jgi:hypothetical protein
MKTRLFSLAVLFLACFSLQPLTAQRLVPFQAKSGLYGYQYSHSGEVVINASFEQAKEFRGNLGRVKRGGSWGLIDRQGKFVVTPQYKFIFPFHSSGLALVCTGGDDFGVGSKWGFIDERGKEIIKPRYDRIELLDNGYVKICEGGYFEEIGEVTYVKLEDQENQPPAEEKNKIWINGRWGLLNQQGMLAVPVRFTQLDAFGPGNQYFKACLQCQVDRSDPHNPNRWIGGQQGLLDMDGREFSPLAFSYMAMQPNQTVLVGQGGRYFDTDTQTWKGKGRADILRWETLSVPNLQLRFDQIHPFSEGLALVAVALPGGKQFSYGFIDETGFAVIHYDMNYAVVHPFQQGLAKVGRSFGLDAISYGYINKEGALVVDAVYEDVKLQGNDICMREKGNWQCISRQEAEKMMQAKLKEEAYDQW